MDWKVTESLMIQMLYKWLLYYSIMSTVFQIFGNIDSVGECKLIQDVIFKVQTMAISKWQT